MCSFFFPSCRFAIYSLKVFSNIRPSVFSFLSRIFRLMLGSFTPVLPSGSTRQLFPNVHSFRILGATLSLSHLLRSCPLRRATLARFIISLLATANSFRDSRLAWIRIFLVQFLFRHTTFAQRDTFLQATANYLLDPRYPWVLSFIFWRGTATRLQSLRRFLGPLWTASFLDQAQSLLLCCMRSSHPALTVRVVLWLSFHVGWSPSTQTGMHRLWILFLLDLILCLLLDPLDLHL
jgi:hypothetical protein